MARKPNVRVKNGRWYSEAGGVGRYLGRVEAMSRDEAQDLLLKALEAGSPPTPRVRPKTKPKAADEAPLSVDALRTLYLDWVSKNRSSRLHVESRRHLERFCRGFGRRRAVDVTGGDLEAFLDKQMRGGMSPAYARKHSVSVRTMFSRGRKAGWLPAGFRPFESVEQIRVPTSPLLEGDLPTAEEVESLLRHAKGVLADLVRVYHATGARTHELLDAKVGDFQVRTRTLVLGRHKRSETLRAPTPRTITLNQEAFSVVQRACGGRKPSEPIFPCSNGKPYTSGNLNHRWQVLRRRAGVRDSVTPYSFRHLWISEALMSGLDAMLVAKMAGTSVAMIEQTYGHWRMSAFREAQTQLDAMRGTRR